MKQKRIIIISILSLAVLAIVTTFALRNCGNGNEPGDTATARIDTIPYMMTRMQQVSRLNTAELKVHKIITHDDIMKLSGTVLGKELSVNIPAGKRKVAIPLYATIKASIDLTKLTADDFLRYGDKIEVLLPQPDVVITETHIDHEGIKQYVALTRSRFSDEELLSYERQGRAAIERDIPSMNITAVAKESAARQLVPIIQAMGFAEENITISFRNDGRNNTILRKTE